RILLFLNLSTQLIGYTGYKSYVGYKVIMATKVMKQGIEFVKLLDRQTLRAYNYSFLTHNFLASSI
ncbi:hypothetical protein, partial [Elizabethkingia miricola]|uniref:hypothetical protein n=1 Tax=Elizabethkingia miricola TaxID=172045 RepID=UPI001C8898B1